MTEQPWVALARQVAWLRAGLIVALLLIAGLIAARFIPQETTATIRTQGIAILDAEGRERILIGAPVPASADRKRKDGDTTSMVFVSADGADRLIVGASPGASRDGKTMQRIAEAYGVVLHDEHGDERGGIAFLGNGRAAVVLDRAAPSGDAVAMMVDDKSDFAGILMAYPGPAGGFLPALRLGSTGAKASIEMFDPKGTPRARLAIDGADQPQWKLAGD